MPPDLFFSWFHAEFKKHHYLLTLSKWGKEMMSQIKNRIFVRMRGGLNIRQLLQLQRQTGLSQSGKSLLRNKIQFVFHQQGEKLRLYKNIFRRQNNIFGLNARPIKNTFKRLFKYLFRRNVILLSKESFIVERTMIECT